MPEHFILALKQMAILSQVTTKVFYLILQYRVFNYTISTPKEGSWIQVKIIFQRIFLYHLTNTYLPSACLVIIFNYEIDKTVIFLFCN